MDSAWHWSQSGDLLIPLELLTGLDVGIFGGALHECAHPLDCRGNHPTAIHAHYDEIRFFFRVLDQVEYHRHLGLDECAGCGLGISEDYFHSLPLDRQNLTVGPIKQHVIPIRDITAT